MRRTPLLGVAFALAVGVAAAPAAALAAEPAKGSKPAAVRKPPELIEFVHAVYPEEAAAKGLSGTVVLRIDIDALGGVTNVAVDTPAGNGFDEAAVAAARLFRFKPATVDGIPSAARILYPYRFTLAPAPASAPASGPASSLPAELGGDAAPPASAPAPLNFYGKVLMRGVRDPIPDAEVNVPALGLSAITGEDGKFSLHLPPGKHHVIVAAPGFFRIESDEVVPEGKALEITYWLRLEGTGFRTTVRDKREVRDVAVRDISTEEIKKIPGTMGDAFKVIQIMPGVARMAADFGLVVVRGSDPEDSRYFFMGSPILNLYHFGGIRAIVNADMLERLDFMPGGFGVRYGRAMGGVIEVEPRLANAERFHGYIDTNVFDTGVFLEGPIPVTDNLGFMAGYRRSYIDLILPAVLPLFSEDDGAAFTVSPRWWDYQTIVSWKPTPRDDVRLMVFGAVDKVSLVISDAELADIGARGGVDLLTYLHRVIARYKTRLSPRLSNELMISGGPGVLSFAAGIDFYFRISVLDLAVRDELTVKLAPTLDLALGFDGYFARFKVGFRSPINFEEDKVPEPISTTPIFEYSDSDYYYDAAFYVEGRWRPFKSLLVVPGLRFDYFWFDEDAYMDPRLNVRWALHDRFTLKGSIGRFSQPPSGLDVVEPTGSAAARAEFAWQYVAGFEVKITEFLDLDVQAYWKDMRNLLVSPERSEVGGDVAPPINLGSGTVYGLEVLLRHRFGHNFFGWVSYTLSRATRLDRPGEDPYFFDFDQTHILSLVAHYKLPLGFEVGVRWRYVTGNPGTPLAGGIYDADADSFLYLPGRLNSVRTPPFHQLDVRIDKGFVFKTWSLAIYLDVQNAYNRKNPEGEIYNFDYTERAFVSGLPIIPSLGIKGAF